MNLEKRGDYNALVLSAPWGKVQMQLFNSLSEKCRTPGECRIQRHGLFCALKRLFLLMSHLSGA